MSRRGRLAAALAGAATAALLAVAPALAVGTAGVEMTPVLPQGHDGRFELTLDGAEVAAFAVSLENLSDVPASVRLFAAAASPDLEGSFTIGAPGSSPFVALDRPLEVGPGERTELPVTLDAPDGLEEATYVALVLEANPSESLVTQAATIVRIRPPLPLLQRTGPLVAAVVLLMVAVTALARFGRVRLEQPAAEEAQARP